MHGNEAIAVVIREMVNAVNRGDFRAALGAFSEAPVIVEDIAPYCWRGAGAPSQWLEAMGANAARLNVSAVLMTLQQPTRIDVDADAAYALFPGRLSLMRGGGDELVADGTLTFTLRQGGGRWRIDTLVWSGPDPAPR